MTPKFSELTATQSVISRSRIILHLGLFGLLFALPSGCVAQSAVKSAPVVVATAKWPVPVVGWSASQGKAARVNTPVAPGLDTLSGVGSDPQLNALHVVGSGDPKRANLSPVFWMRGTQEPAALALALRDNNTDQNPVLQAGDDKSSLAALTGDKLTLFIEFKLIGQMMMTGNPRFEEDGLLIGLGPDVSLNISGRGRDGKSRRTAILRVKEKSANGDASECNYTMRLDDELQLGTWYRLAISWNGGENGEKRVDMALNGMSKAVTFKGNSLNSPVKLNPTAPLLVGGNRSWSNIPIHLGAFAIYNQTFAPSELTKLSRAALPTPATTTETAKELPQYEKLAGLNKPDAWNSPDAPVQVDDAKGDMLRISLANSTFQDTKVLRLKNTIALDSRVKSVNFWACMPPRGKGAMTLTPLFADVDGGEIEGQSQLFLSEHASPPNSRKSGLWFYRFIDLPNGARSFLGFKIKAEDTGGPRNGDPTDAIYIKDIGLERIDYARASLYYVVGNYRDNFRDTHYNNMGARALTETSGESTLPYILVDNVVDQVKEGRPPVLDLELDAYDTADRRVWTQKLSKLAAVDVPDSFKKITVPITQPGTYRIRGKSYNSATGEYFTTDWTKLVIVKGKAQTLQPVVQGGLLEINSDKPFGRLEKTDPRSIKFSFAGAKAGPVSLRYSVIPYDENPPRTSAKRDLQLTTARELTATTPVTVAYEPKRTVELIVAELWQNGKCIEHEERPIGIANSLDKAPAFTIANQVPTLDDLAGKGKVWKTITVISNAGGNQLEDMERNIGEAKKLAQDIGFETDTARLVPIPGVYDWDALKPFFDLAAKNGCRVILYLNQKWPPEWAPVEWASDGSGQIHRSGTIYAYMVGKSIYATGQYGPEILRNFNQQLARRFLNDPGFGGFYFENEHLDTQWEKHPASRSYHETYRKGFVQFVKKRYVTIAKLNEAYGTKYTAFDEVRLPDVDNQAEFPKKVMFADFRLFQREEIEKFVLRDQFDTARAEDPRRPIIVYGIGEESYNFLDHIAKNGGLIANGGVHSRINVDYEYERANSVPGLSYRMEPHDVANYDPIPHGFDEMIFGMLATGGRGMHAHIFLYGWQTFNYEKAMQPGQRTGLDKLVAAEPMMKELRDAQKLHDPIGILELRSQGPWEPGIWEFHAATYAFSHYNPKSLAPEGNLNYLDGSKLIDIGRNTIDAEQLAYLTKYIREGGKVVMELNSAQFSLEKPDAPGHNALLDSLGIDFFADGKKLPEVNFPHDVYEVGKGQIMVVRGAVNADAWEAALPSVTKWAGITERLANSPDRYMQMHVLEKDGTYYLATTHRGENQGFNTGPKEWEGKVQFLKPLNGARYKVTEMMSRKVVGTFTPQELAAGFDAGKYEELQMKLFKIELA